MNLEGGLGGLVADIHHNDGPFNTEWEGGTWPNDEQATMMAFAQRQADLDGVPLR